MCSCREFEAEKLKIKVKAHLVDLIYAIDGKNMEKVETTIILDLKWGCYWPGALFRDLLRNLGENLVGKIGCVRGTLVFGFASKCCGPGIGSRLKKNETVFQRCF